jgi:hypothetical protein
MGHTSLNIFERIALSMLMFAGIRDILVISTRQDLLLFRPRRTVTSLPWDRGFCSRRARSAP